MIRRYILHLEFHWGYWPTIRFKRAPRDGDRMVDGGVPGQLVACKECSSVGFLHQPDSFAGLWPEPPKPLFPPPEIHHWRGTVCQECEADVSWCDNPHIKVDSRKTQGS